MVHYHVDLFEVGTDGQVHFVQDTEGMPKRAALRKFSQMVSELSGQLGKFRVHRGDEDLFPGAIRIAKNHRVVLVVSRCDCDR